MATQPTLVPDDLMTERELAHEWKVAPKSMANARSNGEGPPFVRVLGRQVRYSRRAVDAWLAERQKNDAVLQRVLERQQHGRVSA